MAEVVAHGIAWFDKFCRPAGEEATALSPTANELATLLAAGLEPRDGVPGLFLCRNEGGFTIVPPDGIKLEGRAQKLAVAMRDELATRLRKEGTEGLPTTDQDGKERADLMGAWLKGANLYKTQLQGANLCSARLQGANICVAQLQGANLYEAKLQEAYLLRAQLQKTNLEAAQLEGANISGVTNMQQASFVRANLTGANLTESNLAGADFTSADLTKANLNQVLESMRNYRPPQPPAVLASSLWRSTVVVKSTAEAVYKKLAQADDGDDDDDDDDDDSGGSDDGDDGSEVKLAPWLEAAEEVATQAAGALVAVAQPVLVLVNSTVAELEKLCDSLAERVPRHSCLASCLSSRSSLPRLLLSCRRPSLRV